MTLHERIRPVWIRLTNSEGRYVGSIDPVRGVLLCVYRGGTVTFDLPEIIAEWHKTHATPTLAAGDGGVSKVHS